MLEIEQIRAAIDVADETTLEGPCDESPILAAAVRELYETLNMATHENQNPFAIEMALQVFDRYRAALEGGEDANE